MSWNRNIQPPNMVYLPNKKDGDFIGLGSYKDSVVWTSSNAVPFKNMKEGPPLQEGRAMIWAAQSEEVISKGTAGDSFLTVNDCYKTCDKQGYKYFGLQDGNSNEANAKGECFCSNDIVASTIYGPAGALNKELPGQFSIATDLGCSYTGGPWCNYIYAKNNV